MGQKVIVHICLMWLLVITGIAFSFAQSTTAIYSGGNGPSDSEFVENGNQSSCPLQLKVQIPNNVEITGVDIQYKIVSNNVSINAQYSRLKCISVGGTWESTTSQGVGFDSGELIYNRTNLDIANNVNGGGYIFFELHAGKNIGTGGCSEDYAYVKPNWKITVHYLSNTNCNGTPFGGIATSSIARGCLGTEMSIDLTSSGYSDHLLGLSYQWQRSIDGVSNWTNIVGETNPNAASYSTALTTYFRLSVLCSASEEIGYSNILSFICDNCQGYDLGEHPEPVYTCNALFYDSGHGGNYSNNETKVITFCAENNEHIRVEFLEFEVQDNGQHGRNQIRLDKLTVWDGDIPGSSPLFEFSGKQTESNPVPIVTSSGSCISFEFTSDGYTTMPGWKAHVGCINEAPNVASQYCETAPTICNLDGYLGTTSNFYNIERVNGQIQSESPLFPGSSELDNNSFVKFTASDSEVILGVEISDCNGGFQTPRGVQFAVYSGNNCEGFELVSNPYYVNPGLHEGSHTVTLSGLVAGRSYYLLTDGSFGAICNYSISANSGIELASVAPVNSTICVGESATFTASGGTSYSWEGPNDFTSDNASISVSEEGVYTVKITGGIEGCPSEIVFNATLEVISNILTPTFSIENEYCRGDIIPLLPITSENDIIGYWTPELNNQETTTYSFTSTSDMCAKPASVTINILHDIEIETIEPDCFGETGTLLFLSNSPYTPITFFVNDTPATSPFPIRAGDYTIVGNDSKGCSSIETFSLNQPDSLSIDYELVDRTCYGNIEADVYLSATGGTSPYFFNVTSNETTIVGDTIENIRDSLNIIEVQDSKNCIDNQNLIIYQPAPLTSDYIVQNPSCIGNIDGQISFHTIGGTAPYHLLWNGVIIDTTIISGISMGSYDIDIIDANSCEYKINGIALNDIEIDCIKIPNAFTPNNDGINDIWIIENLELYPNAYLQVYNRWGQKLYAGSHIDKWDGTYNGKFVPSGTFVYILNLYNGDDSYIGTVNVVY